MARVVPRFTPAGRRVESLAASLCDGENVIAILCD